MHQWSFAIFMPYLRDADESKNFNFSSRLVAAAPCPKADGNGRWSAFFLGLRQEWGGSVEFGGWRGLILKERGLGYTPQKINMEHQNGGSEDELPFQLDDF